MLVFEYLGVVILLGFIATVILIVEVFVYEDDQL